MRLLLRPAAPGGYGFGDIFGNPKEVLRQLADSAKEAVDEVGSALKGVGAALKAGDPGAAALREAHVPSVEALEAADEAEARGEALDDFKYYAAAALVTRQEWDLLLAGEADGVPKWRTVYTWARAPAAPALSRLAFPERLFAPAPRRQVAALMAEAQAEGRLTGAQRSGPEMQAMCRDMRDAAGRMFTMMSTQARAP